MAGINPNLRLAGKVNTTQLKKVEVNAEEKKDDVKTTNLSINDVQNKEKLKDVDSNLLIAYNGINIGKTGVNGEINANKVPKKEDITSYEDLQKRFNNGEFEDLTGMMQGTIYSEDGHLYYWCVGRSAETGKITLETKQIF